MTIDTITVRAFHPDDIEAVLAISESHGLSPWSRNDLGAENVRTDSYMAVASVGSRPVGFIVARRVPGSRTGGGSDAEIYNIGVDKEYQGAGIGTRLIREFLEQCRSAGIEDIWLEVRAGNESAIRFYKKLGFVEFSVRPNFYRDPAEDAVIMRLGLTGEHISFM